MASNRSSWTQEALQTLGIDHFALIAFDSALPQHKEWDVGTGSPYSRLARDFFAFVRELGFNGIQFGPQGAVSRDFPSPYDATAFSRNPLSIALDGIADGPLLDDANRLLEGGILPGEDVERALSSRPREAQDRVIHDFAFDTQARLLGTVAERLKQILRLPKASTLVARFGDFRSKNRDWLVADALYDILCMEHGVFDFTAFGGSTHGQLDAKLWQTEFRSAPRAAIDDDCSLLGHRLPAEHAERLSVLTARYARELESYALIQFLAHEQHSRLHAWAGDIGLELYGDMQVGYSRRDLWHFGSVFLERYRLGAPPSRTNPEGQPWGCPVLDPRARFEPDGGIGPALRLLARRAEKHFSDYDRIRVDHPHGLVCPWVYRHATGDDIAAVQGGARLFSSPALPDHPELAGYALVQAAQLDRTKARHADDWVRSVTPEQTERFAACFDVLASEAKRRGSLDRLICEVLSTQPLELGAVLRHYGLGRFRVTQKAKLENPDDVYVSDNARAEDWMLIGNHDTPTIWQLLPDWWRRGEHERQAEYLSKRLSHSETHRRSLKARFVSDAGELAHAKLADLFVGEARHVMVSFGDLFGLHETFNAPGTVSGANWSQRIPEEFRAAYEARRAAGTAFDVRRALRLALEAQAPGSALLKNQTC